MATRLDKIKLPAPRLTLSDLKIQAQEIIAAGVPENTRRTYRTQWQNFKLWCAERELVALPTEAQTLLLYLTDRSKEVKVATLEVALAAITVAHRESGLQDWGASDLEGVKVFMRGLRRTKGTPAKKAMPIRLSELESGLPQGSELICVRNRAILLVGFYAALRRSELIGLNLEDLQISKTQAVLSLWKTKTDKALEGQVVNVPRLDGKHCPVSALESWLQVRFDMSANSTANDAVFISQRSKSRLTQNDINRIVKLCVERAGLDASLYSAHSLRAGFATDAARAGVEERDIMRITRHTSVMTLRGYIREGEMETKHPGLSIKARISGENK